MPTFRDTGAPKWITPSRRSIGDVRAVAAGARVYRPCAVGFAGLGAPLVAVSPGDPRSPRLVPPRRFEAPSRAIVPWPGCPQEEVRPWPPIWRRVPGLTWSPTDCSRTGVRARQASLPVSPDRPSRQKQRLAGTGASASAARCAAVSMRSGPQTTGVRSQCASAVRAKPRGNAKLLSRQAFSRPGQSPSDARLRPVQPVPIEGEGSPSSLPRLAGQNRAFSARSRAPRATA